MGLVLLPQFYLMLHDYVTQGDGHAKSSEGAACQVQLLEHIYKYFVAVFQLEGGS